MILQEFARLDNIEHREQIQRDHEEHCRIMVERATAKYCKYYNMCYQIVTDIVDLSTKVAEYRELTSWWARQIFFRFFVKFHKQKYFITSSWSNFHCGLFLVNMFHIKQKISFLLLLLINENFYNNWFCIILFFLFFTTLLIFHRFFGPIILFIYNIFLC